MHKPVEIRNRMNNDYHGNANFQRPALIERSADDEQVEDNE